MLNDPVLGWKIEGHKGAAGRFDSHKQESQRRHDKSNGLKMSNSSDVKCVHSRHNMKLL